MILNLCRINGLVKQNVLLYNTDVVRKEKMTDVFHSIGNVTAKKTVKTVTTNHHLALREYVLWVSTNAITKTVH